MDYITKNKLVTLLVLFLCCTNLVVVIFMFNVFSHRPDFRMKDPMSDRLKMTIDQKEQIFSLRKNHRKKLHELFDATDELRRQMANFAFEEAPQPEEIQEVADALGRMNAKFEISQYENMREVIAVLTAEQIQELKLMMEEMAEFGPMLPGGIFMGGPGGPGGPPPGIRMGGPPHRRSDD